MPITDSGRIGGGQQSHESETVAWSQIGNERTKVTEIIFPIPTAGPVAQSVERWTPYGETGTRPG